MFYLKETITNTIIIEKSEFIGIITPVQSTDEFPDILKDIKKKYPKATHYCTAYVIENTQGSNDDGEPSGTAGIPILEILNHYGLKNVYAVVVRYFGGIKLGAGGLIRAYAKATKEALNLATIEKKETTLNYEVSFSYDKIHTIDSIFQDHIIDKTFLTDVTYMLSFIGDTSLLDKNSYLFSKIKNHGPREILVPWHKINEID
ncbi:YigZ family protein [Acholeplasma equirhinis]|uniref:IMPACT family protein n=1 Tax=Acholeplasma equirhinis TaxID=555393 RepID=UPI00197AA706|nr:YigZ family protein [Acholeplasma equirhinis]MBN3490844.1 YigZ family protein [Acholeplasma equirhinis]